MRSYYLDIVSVEEKIFSDFVKKIQVVGSEGEMGIFPRHAPLLAYIKPGIVHIFMINNEIKYIYLSGGILEVQPDVVTILADVAIRAEDLDENKVVESERKVQKSISNFYNNDLGYAQIAAEISKAIRKLRMLERVKR
ncbi:ATP synthase epsilon chain [Blochmannia endosymbiont of Polyrhachis (Hedomyrma) turneri]|nr:ATP synthase epsilon chain [Blochmannia endosymbiont of Polyrhachis (Hedomyrma) turneri]